MSLKLALVIDGDPAGAKKALADTASAVDALAKKTGEANKAAEGGRNVWGDVAGSAGDAAGSIGKAAEASGALAPALGDVGVNAGRAAPEIDKAGAAAGNAGTGFSNLKMNVAAIAISFAAGLGTGLLVTAFDTLVSKGAEFARGILSDGPRIEADLKSHAALVRDIKGAYAEAEGAASSYGNKSGSLLKFQAQQDQARLERDFKDAARTGFDDIGAPAKRPDSPFAGALGALRTDLKEGKADVIAFRTEVSKIGEALPADSPFRAMGEDILDATQKAAGIQEELSRTSDLLKGLSGDAEAAATALGGTAEKYGAIGDSAGAAAPALDATADGIIRTGDAAGAATGQLNDYAAALRAASGTVSLPSVPSVPAGPPEGASLPTGYAGGGYTGDHDVSAAVGIVHGKEYVFDAASTARIGVPTLEAMRKGVKGYADGGFVGSMAAGASGAIAIPAGGVMLGASADELNRLQASLNGVAEAAAESGDDVDDFSDRFAEGLADLGQSLLDSFLSILKTQLTNALQQAFSGAGSGGGGGLGGFFSSLFGGLFGGSSLSPAIFSVISSGGGGLFDEGGWTGPGGKFDPKGIVHADEFIFTKEETNAIGVNNLRAIAKASKTGFAEGGYTGGTAASGGGFRFGGAPQITFNNIGTPQKIVDQREEDDGQGGRRTIFVIDDAMARNVSQAGTATGKALRTAFGQQRKTVMR